MIPTFNAAWLLRQEFPPLQYAVPGIIPEGMSLLVGGPKVGKSWFVLDLSYAAATGGIALGGIRVDAKPVLYLALEDGQRRLQSRLRTLGYEDGPEGLNFVISLNREWPPEAVIAQFLADHAGSSPLVVLDTLGKTMPPARPSEGAYERDYRVAGALKGLVDAHPGASLVVVHHTNKSQHGDFVDRVSGTNGIAGAADSILVLARDRNETTATLSVTSRDAAEGIYQLEQPTVGRWELAGGSLDAARAAYEQSKATEGVGDVMANIIAVVGEHPEGISTAELASATGISDSAKLGTYLRRAVEAGRIGRPRRGTYTPVSNDSSVSSVSPCTPVRSVSSVSSDSELNGETNTPNTTNGGSPTAGTNTPNTTNRGTQGGHTPLPETDGTAEPTAADRCSRHGIPKAGPDGQCLACQDGSNDD